MAPHLDKASERILTVIADGQIEAVVDPFDAGRVVMRGRRNGVSVQVGCARRAQAEALVREGLAEWRGDPTAPRLVTTQTGRAALARATAPDGADPFFAQHMPLARKAPDHGAPAALTNEAESPLAWLARRRGRDGARFLDPAAVEAGERLRRDLTFAHMLPRVTANWASPIASGRRGAGVADALDTTIAARQRVDHALAAVGSDLSGLLLDVCGFLKGLETVEVERGWPARSGKIVLRIALGRLAEHYGLASEVRGRASAPLRAWSAGDYAPAPEPGA